MRKEEYVNHFLPSENSLSGKDDIIPKPINLIRISEQLACTML